jgi:sugar lactone lactonase YvrE
LLALGNGYLYSANPEEATVSRIAPDGTEQILAGRPFQPGTQDGDRQTARFISPVSVALDGHGNLLVADAGTLSVRRITPEGVVTTLAGGGSTSGGFADGTGTEAGFGSVGALAVDRDDIIYVTDPLNQALRKVTSAGVVSTITTNIICAGVSAVPTGGVVTFDESASTLLWITGDGTTTTTVGLTDKISGAIGGIAVGVDGVVFLSDYPGHTLWKATSSGANSLYAGETDVQGTRDGSVNAARFYLPGSLSIDPQGNLYVADSRGLVVRRIDPTGLVETLGVASRSLDGPADIADLVAPQGVVVDSRGNLFVTETSLNTIRKINPDGAIITWAGMPGVDGYADGLGSYARFSGPMDLAIDQYDNLYVTDVGNLAIRKIAPDGTVTTLAGPVAGFHTTDPTSPSMRVPARHGIAVDLDGNVYFNDSTGAIRKICADGKIRVFAGEDRNFYSVGVGEGAPEYSLTIGPDALRALAVDTVGNIYAAGNQGSQIYKMVTGLPPERLIPFDTIGEGALNSGGFNNASGIAVDRLGNVFLSQRSRAALCKIDVRGWLSTIAGNYEGLDIANASGGFTSLAMGKAGELYVSDAGGRSVIKGVPLTVGGPKLEIYRSGDTIVASWLMDRKDYQVESSDSPQGESEWTPVTEGITESVNRFFLTAVATQTTRYYRLRQRP